MDDDDLTPRPIAGRATWAVALLLVGVLFAVLAVHESLHAAASDLVRVSQDGGLLPNNAAAYGWAGAAAFITGGVLLVQVVFALGRARDAAVGAVARPGLFDPPGETSTRRASGAPATDG